MISYCGLVQASAMFRLTSIIKKRSIANGWAFWHASFIFKFFFPVLQ